jgi:hypothetical protein
MRCCASQTTSIAADPRAREAATQFEALLFAQALSPLAKTMGSLGDIVIDACAREIVARQPAGLATRLLSALDATGGGR